jgi:hypothetical protein
MSSVIGTFPSSCRCTVSKLLAKSLCSHRASAAHVQAIFAATACLLLRPTFAENRRPFPAVGNAPSHSSTSPGRYLTSGPTLMYRGPSPRSRHRLRQARLTCRISDTCVSVNNESIKSSHRIDSHAFRSPPYETFQTRSNESLYVVTGRYLTLRIDSFVPRVQRPELPVWPPS